MDKEKILEIAKPHDTWNSGFTDKEYYGFTTEDLIAFAHAIIETERESSGECKKLLAYKTLAESLEARLASHEKNRLSYQEAIEALESERECNARLTKELADLEISEGAVAWIAYGKDIKAPYDVVHIGSKPPPLWPEAIPLYRHPPPKRKLTDEEIQFMWGAHDQSGCDHYVQFARDLERRINGEEE